MICRKVKRLVKPSLLMLCAVVLSLTALRPTMAKSRTYAPSLEAVTLRKSEGAAINANVVKRALLRIIRDKVKANPKLAKSLPAGCNCAVAPAAAGFASCMRTCLADAGVDPMAIASCGTVCSINLVGCAICVGVGEWVVAGCAQYCAWIKVFKVQEEARQLPRSKARGVQRASLSSTRAITSS